MQLEKMPTRAMHFIFLLNSWPYMPPRSDRMWSERICAQCKDAVATCVRCLKNKCDEFSPLDFARGRAPTLRQNQNVDPATVTDGLRAITKSVARTKNCNAPTCPMIAMALEPLSNSSPRAYLRHSIEGDVPWLQGTRVVPSQLQRTSLGAVSKSYAT
jgi:hypothetical protein